MVEADIDHFVALLRDVFGLYPHAKPLTEGQVSMFFRALSGQSLAAVRQGLDAHVRDTQRGRFPPLPADVLAQIEGLAKDDGRPGPEEAWAIAASATSEAVTVVWTQEIAQAWAISRPVAATGDDVGARMAFKEAYARLVAEARADRQPAKWSPSFGHDPQLRTLAIGRAVSDGRLPASMALDYQPAEPTLLLGMTPSADDQPQKAAAIQALQALRQSLAAEWTGPSAADLERERTEELKAEAQRKVDEAMAQRGEA